MNVCCLRCCRSRYEYNFGGYDAISQVMASVEGYTWGNDEEGLMGYHADFSGALPLSHSTVRWSVLLHQASSAVKSLSGQGTASSVA